MYLTVASFLFLKNLIYRWPIYNVKTFNHKDRFKCIVEALALLWWRENIHNKHSGNCWQDTQKWPLPPVFTIDPKAKTPFLARSWLGLAFCRAWWQIQVEIAFIWCWRTHLYSGLAKLCIAHDCTRSIWVETGSKWQLFNTKFSHHQSERSFVKIYRVKRTGSRIVACQGGIWAAW